MKILRIPYPRPSFRQYLWLACFTAFSVGFTLIVFQPFGTANFQHPQKNWILAGYGFCVFVTLSIFYFLSTQVIHKNKEDRWTILLEVMELFLASFLSLLACYIYFVEIFNLNYRLSGMLHFISIAASVAMLPVLVCFGNLYFTWKDVVRSSIQPTTKNTSSGKLILILGNNKTDQIEATSDEVILAQAQNNYVLLYLEKNEKIQRHIIRSTLKQLKEQLDENIFLQAHRSFIINQKRIKKLTGNKSKAHIELVGLDKKIPISRNIYDLLKPQSN